MDAFVGYSGQVWQTVYKALNFYLSQLDIADINSNPASVIALSKTMLTTLSNGVEAINANDYVAGWMAEYTLLNAISALPLTGLTAAQTLIFNNRIQAYATAYPALQAIVPQAPFLNPSISMPNGLPPIPTFDLLSFYADFDFETGPVGLTSTSFIADAQLVADAFEAIATSISVFQGSFPTNLYDAAVREQDTAQEIVDILSSFTTDFSTDIATTNLWNQSFSLPTMTVVAADLVTAPYLRATQQSDVIRYAMLNTAYQISLFLLSLEQPIAAQANIAIVKNGDTPMDIAARELGDIEQWREIVTLNGLVPPWFAATSSTGVAAYGSKILLPSPGSNLSATGQPPSYNQNFLGTDLYFGPINGDMPDWAGDFQTITGINNLSWALGRRLQTTLGTLIYHSDYGSRLPPEIGQIQDQNTAGHILAFGQSALLSDPRVRAVLNASARILTNSTISFQGVVQLIGDRASKVSVNQVIVGQSGAN